MNMLYNFAIRPGKPVSDEFIRRGVHDFASAVHYVQHLPYKRNTDKNDLHIVLKEHAGTCSTKHVLLKVLADENGKEKEISLILGIFNMNAKNTRDVKPVLEKYRLDTIPEAHNYLKMGNKIIDATKPGVNMALFVHDIIHEEPILPGQITHYKVMVHQRYLQEFLETHPEYPYSQGQIWTIREECIAALSGAGTP